MGHGGGEGCNNDIRGWSYSIPHYCSIFCSSLHFLGTCLYYFTKLRIIEEYRYSSGIVVNFCRYTIQHGGEAAAYKKLQYIIAHHLCNVAHGAKKAFTMLPVFLVAYCKIGIEEDGGCWAIVIDMILKRQAQL